MKMRKEKKFRNGVLTCVFTFSEKEIEKEIKEESWGVGFFYVWLLAVR